MKSGDVPSSYINWVSFTLRVDAAKCVILCIVVKKGRGVGGCMLDSIVIVSCHNAMCRVFFFFASLRDFVTSIQSILPRSSAARFGVVLNHVMHHVRECVYMCVRYTCVCIFLWVCVCPCAYVRTYVCAWLCVCVCVKKEKRRARARVRVCVCAVLCMYSRWCVCVCVRMCVFVLIGCVDRVSARARARLRALWSFPPHGRYFRLFSYFYFFKPHFVYELP